MRIQPKLILLASTAISAILIIVSVFLIVQSNKVGEVGAEIGTDFGKAVGTAVGSMKGLTVGQLEGSKDGKELGLSAVDTKAVLEKKFLEVNKLEVLDVEFTAHNDHKITADKKILWYVVEEDYVKYAALSITKGNAVYTVDLSQAEITVRDDKGVDIWLPEPEIQVREGGTEMLATYQANDYTGSADDGMDAALNSAKQEYEKKKAELMNDKELMESAKHSAMKCVTQIAENVRSSESGTVNVYFAGEAGETDE